MKYIHLFLIICIIDLALSVGTVSSAERASSGIFTIDDHNVAIVPSIGVPDLLNFQVQFIRLKWIKFGFGYGVEPADYFLKKYININPLSVNLVGSSYVISPDVSLGLATATSFVRIFPGIENFYIQLKYSTWNISARVNLPAKNTSSGQSIDMGNVSISGIAPMVGMNIGYMSVSKSGFVFDAGLGALYFFDPQVSIGFGGLAGSAVNLAQLDPAMNGQIQNMIAQAKGEIQGAVTSLRNSIPVIPVVYISVGWAF